MKPTFTVFFIVLLIANEIISQDVTGKGTFILLVQTKDSIFIAADSKEIIMKDNGEKEFKNTCKIKVANNFGYAFAGLSSSSKYDFDIRNICEEALKQDNGIFSKIAFIDSTVKKYFTKMYRDKKIDPLLFSEVALFTFMDHRPIILKNRMYFDSTYHSQRTFLFNNIASNFVILSGIIGDYINKIDPKQEQFERYKDIPLWMLMDITVEKVIKIFPQQCGPPIEILVFGENGFRWIQNQLNCD